MAERERGLYFNRASAGLQAVFDDEKSPRPPGWEKISDDPSTRLLEARRILVRNGLSEDEAGEAYWQPTNRSTSLNEVTDEHIRNFKRAADAARERAEQGSPGVFARLKELLFGRGHDEEGAKPLI